MSESTPEETAGETLAPYTIEGARSSRSRCKTCRRKIDRGALRIGMLIEGPYGTGYLWHHLKCAARRHFDRVAEAYDQQAWNAAKERPARLPDLEELRRESEVGEQRRQTKKLLPYVELAPTGRSRCKQCGEPIGQGEPRVAVGRGVTFGNQVRVAVVNVHPRCVRAELATPDSATEAPGFASALREHSADLGAEQIDAVLAEIGAL